MNWSMFGLWKKGLALLKSNGEIWQKENSHNATETSRRKKVMVPDLLVFFPPFHSDLCIFSKFTILIFCSRAWLLKRGSYHKFFEPFLYFANSFRSRFKREITLPLESLNVSGFCISFFSKEPYILWFKLPITNDSIFVLLLIIRLLSQLSEKENHIKYK